MQLSVNQYYDNAIAGMEGGSEWHIAEAYQIVGSLGAGVLVQHVDGEFNQIEKITDSSATAQYAPFGVLMRNYEHDPVQTDIMGTVLVAGTIWVPTDGTVAASEAAPNFDVVAQVFTTNAVAADSVVPFSGARVRVRRVSQDGTLAMLRIN